MDGARLGRLRHRAGDRRRLCRPSELRHGDHRPAARGPGLPGRHHRAARLAVGRAVQGAGQAARCSSASPAATWTPWSTATRRTAGCATTTPTRPAARAASGRTAAPSSTPSAAARRSRTCRSCSAASRRRCAASRITTTGPRRCAARSWPTPRPTCCSTAMPSARSSRWRTGSPPATAPRDLDDIRGVALFRRVPEDYTELHADDLDSADEGAARRAGDVVIRLPAYEQVEQDKEAYARASRVLHRESNPGNARPLVQRHGDRDLWLNPPPIPLTTDGDGRGLRPALRARAASVLWRCEDPGLGHDQVLGDDHARLLRRLHLLLDHRARGPHHPEPLGRLDPAARSSASATRRRASPA